MLRSPIKRLILLLVAGSAAGLSGCYALVDDCMDCEQYLVNQYKAHTAWCSRSDCYECVDNRCDFANGFRDGYRATADKGDHCLPLMPPRKYWKHCYQDCDGRQQIDSWYEGYAHGMLAANQEGLYEKQQVPFYGLHQYGGMSNASHSITIEGQEQVPAPTPMTTLPVNPTYEPAPAPPVIGHSIPVPDAPAADIADDLELTQPSQKVIAPRFVPEYPDESTPRTIKPLGPPLLPLPDSGPVF